MVTLKLDLIVTIPANDVCQVIDVCIEMWRWLGRVIERLIFTAIVDWPILNKFVQV